MIFPGSRIWYEGATMDLSVLTEEIKTSGFSGHIVLEFHESLDLVVVSNGEFLQVIEKIGRRIMTTKKYREIWGKCQIKQGKMLIFELPPALAARLKGMSHRRLLCTGGLDKCDLKKFICEQKKAGLTGFIDCDTSEGKGLLELHEGEITSCYFTEHHGLAFTGYDAFLRLHQSLRRSESPPSLHVSNYVSGVDNSHLWSTILSERMEDVTKPLCSVEDRLFAAYGMTSFEGEKVFDEGESLDKAFYILEGDVELSRQVGKSKLVLGYLGAGTVLGLSWLNGGMLPPRKGTAVSDCRFLAFDRSQMEHILFNSPPMAARLIMKAASQLNGLYRRSAVFKANPRIKDLEDYVLQVLNNNTSRLKEGLPPGELFRELAQLAPFSLPEMDQMARELVRAGRINLDSARVTLHPDEI